ncbi:hypothetical protein [uncultured Prevotella sp.]|uniref:hypothetical protein n=1 Tax=uncultured Prevotella sp. TaxID=159272 RepID=UPI0025EEAFBC|nr:hypothetical protein [uncultured Prevotella sp.]
MKARYIFVLLFSLLGLHSQAQSIELIGLVPSADGSLAGRKILAKVDDGGAGISTVQLVSFSLRDGSSTVTSDNIPLSGGYYLLPIPETLDRDFTVPLLDTKDRYAYRAKFTSKAGNNYISEMIEDNGVERFRWIGADVKWNAATSGYDNRIKYDQGIDGGNPFPVDGINFYKSFSTHATGCFTFNFAEDTPYSRLFTYYGIQDNKSAGDIKFTLTVNGELKDTHTMYAKNNPVKPSDGIYLRKYDVAIDGQTDIVINGDMIDDINQDHMNFPLGRLYLKKDVRKEQEATWPATEILAYGKPFKHTLDAGFTSGGTGLYYITSGSEYATIEGNVLNVHTIPTDDSAYIEVAAVQPGTDEYLTSPLSTCRFYVVNDKTVPADGKLMLNNGDEVDELTVYANPSSRGQVVVNNGFASVNKLILKYTFNPGEWNFISFPANASLSQISNLNSLGYTLNGSQKAFYLCEYNTRSRAEQPSKTAWTKLASDNVIKNKGYIMGVSRSADNPDNKPVEVTFVFENTKLGFDPSNNGSLNVELNMMQLEPGSEIPVYVMPDDGLKGSPLKVMVKFSPKDISSLPVNYVKALDDARVTFNPNRSGIRLTLPTQDQAKVVIFDSKEHVVKAVKYVAPYLIDVTDLKPGKYQLYIQYGNATATKPFEVTGKK